MADSLSAFVADLAEASIGATVNPYAVYDPRFDRPDGAAVRAANLTEYLYAHRSSRLLLVGEAPGYRGCRFSGIAFTSERSLPRNRWSSLRPEGWIEPSATIIHGALAAAELEAETVLWNACPLHPAGASPLSNRTPSRAELAAGLGWLDRLIALLSPGRVVAVGRSAAASLPGATLIRHPANGGATACRAGIAALAAELRQGT
jgi:uracil-DNA glycosylase